MRYMIPNTNPNATTTVPSNIEKLWTMSQTDFARPGEKGAASEKLFPNQINSNVTGSKNMPISECGLRNDSHR